MTDPLWIQVSYQCAPGSHVSLEPQSSLRMRLFWLLPGECCVQNAGNSQDAGRVFSNDSYLLLCFVLFCFLTGAFLVAQVVKDPPVMQETWVGKISWRRKWQPTTVLWSGEPHGQRSLAAYSLLDCKALDMIEQLSARTHTHTTSSLFIHLSMDI